MINDHIIDCVSADTTAVTDSFISNQDTSTAVFSTSADGTSSLLWTSTIPVTPTSIPATQSALITGVSQSPRRPEINNVVQAKSTFAPGKIPNASPISDAQPILKAEVPGTADTLVNSIGVFLRPIAPITLPPSRPTIDPEVGREIVQELLSELLGKVPASDHGESSAYKSLGPLGNLLPTLSKLSQPIARLIVSNGKPTVDDIDQILKAIPDVALMLGVAGAMGAGVLPLRGPDENSTLELPDGQPAVNWTLTPDQADGMINGSVPFPPLNSLPPDQVQAILSGGALPGLTVEKTQALKQRYLQHVIDKKWGSDPINGNPSVNITANRLTSIDQKSKNGNQSAQNSTSSVTDDQTINQSMINSTIGHQSIIDNQSPDKHMEPAQTRIDNATKDQSANKSAIYSSDQFKPGSVIESIDNSSSINNCSMGSSSASMKRFDAAPISNPSQSQDFRIGSHPAVEFDHDSVPTSQISDSNELSHRSDKYDMTLIWIAIALGIAGLIAVILFALFCWRRQRNRRHLDISSQHPEDGSLGGNRIRPKTTMPRSAIISEFGADDWASRENRLNAEAEAKNGQTWDGNYGRYERRWE